jgi:hypothetical protein
MANPTLAHVLKSISEIKDKKERVEALKVNGIEPLKAILVGMFHPHIKFALPETDPPYHPSQFNDASVLMRSTKQFFHFAEGGSDISQMRREKLFIDLLESCDPADAELVLAMKNKKSPYPGLTKDVVLAAFPELFPT